MNLEAIYPNPDVVGSELSLEELRARHCGWMSKVWKPEVQATKAKSIPVLRELVNIPEAQAHRPANSGSTKLVILRDADGVDENGMIRDVAREARPRRMKIKEVNETQISEYQ